MNRTSTCVIVIMEKVPLITGTHVPAIHVCTVLIAPGNIQCAFVYICIETPEFKTIL